MKRNFSFLRHLQIVASLRAVEEAWREKYTDVLVPKDQQDWQGRFARDRDRRLYHGTSAPLDYRDRDGFKRRIFADFKEARKHIDSRLAHGIFALGPSCIDEPSLEVLRERLSANRGWDDVCSLAIRLMRLLPVVHQTTAHIGVPAGIKVLDISSGIPMIELTSSFGVTILEIFQLLVRRTFTHISDDGLQLGQDIYEVKLLQRHCRMLFHLLGIWTVGTPYPTPEIDSETEKMAQDPGSLERIGEGHAISWSMNGWCLFEALHEFSHILTGDWLRSPESWTKDDEFVADQFAISCLLLEEHPTIKAWMLWGAILFLNCLHLVEQLYGNTGHHPGADERALRLHQYARANLPDQELELFDFLSALRALPLFASTPAYFGATSEDRFGS